MKLRLEFHLITTIMPHCIYANTCEYSKLAKYVKLQTFVVPSIFKK